MRQKGTKAIERNSMECKVKMNLCWQLASHFKIFRLTCCCLLFAFLNGIDYIAHWLAFYGAIHRPSLAQRNRKIITGYDPPLASLFAARKVKWHKTSLVSTVWFDSARCSLTSLRHLRNLTPDVGTIARPDSCATPCVCWNSGVEPSLFDHQLLNSWSLAPSPSTISLTLSLDSLTWLTK